MDESNLVPKLRFEFNLLILMRDKDIHENQERMIGLQNILMKSTAFPNSSDGIVFKENIISENEREFILDIIVKNTQFKLYRKMGLVSVVFI